jgi:peptidoglycan/xylan/chitin deacetylase (PgdA/CDA1 family)
MEDARRYALTAVAGGKWRVRRPESAVALTFDDGPDPNWTPTVLDTLARHRVRATFFVTGTAASGHPELVARILAEGHSIGIHGSGHRNLRYLPWAEARQEILEGRRQLELALGRPVRLFRPPQGGLTLRAALLVRRTGLRMVMWNRESEDWRPGADPLEVIEHLARSQPGDVILMHDTIANPFDPAQLDRSATVAALDAVLPAIRERGLDFVPL